MSTQQRLKAAFESDDVFVPEADSIDESPESDALQFEDTLSSLESINRVFDETRHVESVHEGLVNLASVAGTFKEASLENLALIQIASNMATIGTNVSAEQLFPSLESSQNTQVSTESIKETALRIWKRIIETLKNLIASFSGFWSSVMDASSRLRRANDRLMSRAKAKQGRQIKTPTIQLNTERSKLEINGKVVGNAAALSKGLIEAQRQLKVVLKQYIDHVTKTGDSLKHAAGQTNLEPEAYLQSSVDALTSMNLTAIASLLNSRQYLDSRFSAGEVVVAPGLLGNRSLFTSNGETRGGTSTLALADKLRSRRISLLHTSTNLSVNMAETIEIQCFSAREILSLGKEVDAILELIGEFTKSSTRDKLAKLSKSVVDAYNTSQTTVYESSLSEHDAALYRSAGRFATAFTSISQNPHDALCTHLLSVCRAVISACNKSINNHG